MNTISKRDFNIELTSKECGTLALAFIKIMLINDWVKHGLPVTLTTKTFHFPDDITPDEELELIMKLDRLQQLAWLRENKE